MITRTRARARVHTSRRPRPRRLSARRKWRNTRAWWHKPIRTASAGDNHVNERRSSKDARAPPIREERDRVARRRRVVISKGARGREPTSLPLCRVAMRRAMQKTRVCAVAATVAATASATAAVAAVSRKQAKNRAATRQRRLAAAVRCLPPATSRRRRRRSRRASSRACKCGRARDR